MIYQKPVQTNKKIGRNQQRFCKKTKWAFTPSHNVLYSLLLNRQYRELNICFLILHCYFRAAFVCDSVLGSNWLVTFTFFVILSSFSLAWTLIFVIIWVLPVELLKFSTPTCSYKVTEKACIIPCVFNSMRQLLTGFIVRNWTLSSFSETKEGFLSVNSASKLFQLQS